ncbi:MAG: outer membrane protein [Acidobacteriota bacterium]|jgi:outer membrane protein TolC|nr:outer membrane protein [Acidobacteriota bacterium]
MRTTLLRSNTSKNRRAAFVLLLGLLAVGRPARAAEVRLDTTAARPAEVSTVEAKDGKVQLSLDQAVEIALRHNLNLVIERYTRTEQRLSLFGALGIYDLNANGTATANSNESPSFSLTQGTSRNNQNLNFNLSQRVPTGGIVSLGWNNSRFEDNSAAQRAAVVYSSGLSFGYDVPLLRNAGRLATERGILVARTNSEIGSREFERQVTLTIQQVENAYWNLVAARDQLGVAEQSLALARELHERNRIQVEVGTQAPLELVQSEAAIATREEGIISATASVGNSEDQLRNLLNLPMGDLWRQPIEPTTRPETERLTINVDEAIRTAYAERPELRTQELQADRAQIEALFAKNQLKPALDLQLGYNFNGSAIGFGDVYSQLFGLGFRGWTAQLQFAYPIQNRAARANSAIANLTLEQARVAVDQQRAFIATEVRQAARGVETAAKQIDAARKSTEYSLKNLDAERKRYENGMSTSFQITQIQDQLTQARSREVAAVVNYRTALAEYYRTIGRLPEQEGVTIDDPQDPLYGQGRFSFNRAKVPGEDFPVEPLPVSIWEK